MRVADQEMTASDQEPTVADQEKTVADQEMNAAGQRSPGLACPLYSALGSMLVAIAIRLVRLYIAVISATSHASSRLRPTSRSDWRSSRVTSCGLRVSFSA